MIVNIQSDSDKVIPHHFDAASALYGASDSGYRWRYMTYEEVESGKYDLTIPNNLYVGSVEFMTEVFNKVNIGLDDIRLPKNSNRKSEITTLGEVRKSVQSGTPLFVKPLQTKLFTGFVMDKLSIRSISNIGDNVEVRVYQPFEYDIISEWRVYVDTELSTENSIHYSIKGIKNYAGDEFIIPSKAWITNIILENIVDGFPTQYTIDVGILGNGNTVVIEFNDMWAIGNYGLDNYTYFHLLRKRYFDIMKRLRK